MSRREAAVTVYGIDFTSAPRRAKPITCACAEVSEGRLELREVAAFPGWEAFEAFLATPGPWVAGFDFPFGQPRRLVEALGWPLAWDDLVETVSDLEPRELAATLTRYSAARPPGDRHHFRAADRRAGSRSPMMTVRVPVAFMWLRGAPRLSRAGLSVLPCRPTSDARVALETYPALAARALLGRSSYKAEGREGASQPRVAARRALARSLAAGAAGSLYGLEVRLARGLGPSLVADGSGDRLDAALCALQAAWSWGCRASGWGIPDAADPLEGWIVDPACLLA